MESFTNWHVHSLCHKPESPYAIVILNEALFLEDINHIVRLWEAATIRICVDGGTNSFYKLMHSPQLPVLTQTFIMKPNEDVPRIHLPDIISGDFDSIEPNILEHFRELDVEIICTPDQNETDFTKALLLLKDRLKNLNIEINHVIVIAGINSNRFDHSMANLNTLYKVRGIFPYPIVIMCGKSLMWLLSPGSHFIEVPPCDFQNAENSWCGYSTFSESAIVSTKGLKWDIENQEVAFGKIISTSNTYDPNSFGKVTIICSGDLLWFMGWTP